MNGRPPSRTPATTALVVLIIIAFALQIGLEFIGIPLTDLLANKASAVKRGEVWRLVTAMFMHAGLLHLMVNLISLFQLGRFYEEMFGTKRFLLIYFISGITASLASFFFTGSSVGASGAIFGILGAMIFSIRRSPRLKNHPIGRSIVGQGVFWIIANLIITWTVPQIDKAGHVGGLIAGLLLGALLPQEPEPPPPPAQAVIDVTPQDN